MEPPSSDGGKTELSLAFSQQRKKEIISVGCWEYGATANRGEETYQLQPSTKFYATLKAVFLRDVEIISLFHLSLLLWVDTNTNCVFTYTYTCRVCENFIWKQGLMNLDPWDFQSW